MLALAEPVPDPAVDVTYVFYAGEEVAAEHNGLGHLVRDRPDLLAGDVAILGEPTDGAIEAGCQGTLRLRGDAPGPAGPHRPAVDGPQRHPPARRACCARSTAFDERRPVIDGCEYREALQAVLVSRRGGRQRRARPGHRHAQPPLRARPHGRRGRGRGAGAAGPGARGRRRGARGRRGAARRPRRSTTRCCAAHRRARPEPCAAKLGWTDVARFAAAGDPGVQPRPRRRHPRPHRRGARRTRRSSSAPTRCCTRVLTTCPSRPEQASCGPVTGCPTRGRLTAEAIALPPASR